MKKIFTLIIALMGVMTVSAQSMKVTKTDGTAYEFAIGEIQSVEFLPAADDGKENGYEFVDLGLPSKTMWAKCNVGASAPEEAGNYFAWGEVEPKSSYTMYNYKYGTASDPESGEFDTLAGITKYNIDPSKGEIDDLDQLLPEDDAAHVNMGGAWRMPTEADMLELLQNCYYEKTKINGVLGAKFTSIANGNSIFLPSVGMSNGEIVIFNGPIDSMKFGFYWTSSLAYEDVALAHYLHTTNPSATQLPGMSYRFYGNSVRAVFKK